MTTRSLPAIGTTVTAKVTENRTEPVLVLWHYRGDPNKSFEVRTREGRSLTLCPSDLTLEG
jgi:hypothetical protein